MNKMKLSTVLLSSAALLVAGAAYAADLPAKKAAPAAAPTGCAAFGAGFFQIPGGDTCIKFSGLMKGTYGSQYDKAAKAPYAFGNGFRLNVNVNSATEMGTLAGFARYDTGSIIYANVNIAGFTFGKADSAFTFYNSDSTEQQTADYGGTANVLQYTAALGSTTSLTLSAEDQTSSANVPSGGAVSHTPDLVGNVKVTSGPATVYVGGAAHQNSTYAASTSAVWGYAGMAGVKFAATKDTTVWLEGAYASGALAYLGSNVTKNTTGSSVAQALTAVADVSANNALVSTGYMVLGAVKQTVGTGYLDLSANYVSLTDNAAAGGTTNISSVELAYAAQPVKNWFVVPSVMASSLNNSSTSVSATSTTALLRIERDF